MNNITPRMSWRRKPRDVVWVVFYHGPGSTKVTIDLQAAWHTKKAALKAIEGKRSYTVEKFVRAGR